jgi:hypothetical protein
LNPAGPGMVWVTRLGFETVKRGGFKVFLM